MAINFYDIAYGFVAGVTAPYWVVRSKTRRKLLDAFTQRMVPRVGQSKAVMIHAVSVGELNAARGMIDGLKERHPDLQLIISTTTATGYERSQQLYADRPDITLIHYPLDFSAAVSRVLDTLKPSIVVLMELELWPNFIAACHRRMIPVVLANGRITGVSFKGYRLGSFITRRMFARLEAVCAQEQSYADRFIELGADPAKTSVTGTMKFDTAPMDASVEGADELAREMNLRSPLWVCGSTGPGEEELILEQYKLLQTDFPDLQLAIIPRKPERFDEVAQLMEQHGFPLVRRSEVLSGVHAMPDNSDETSSDDATPAPTGVPVILGDTMGELRKFYAAADVVFVGRTLLDQGEKQHGSDMIEPAALGKPTVVGRFTGNFTEVMNAFRAAEAMIEIDSAAALRAQVANLLRSPGDIGAKARAVVEKQRGATERTLNVIDPLLSRAPAPTAPASDAPLPETTPNDAAPTDA